MTQKNKDKIFNNSNKKYFDSKNENIELGEDTKKYYNLLNRAIKEHRKVKINYYSYFCSDKGIVDIKYERRR